MTKSEFVDQVADRSGLGKGDAAKAVDAVLDTIEERPEARWRDQLHRLREVLGRRPRRASGRQPADRRAHPDRGQQGAALQCRLRSEEGVKSASRSTRSSSDSRRDLDRGSATAFLPTGLRRSSKSAAAASCSGSTPTRPRSGPRRWSTSQAPMAAGTLAARPHGRRRGRPLPGGDRRGRPRVRGGQAAAGLLRAPRRRPAGRRSRARWRCARDHGPAGDRRRQARRRAGHRPRLRPGAGRARRTGRSARSPGLGADAFTANPLLGRDALEPLIEAAAAAGAGAASCSCAPPTRAPPSSRTSGDPPLHERLARLVDELGADATRGVRALAASARSPAPRGPSCSAACAS